MSDECPERLCRILRETLAILEHEHKLLTRKINEISLTITAMHDLLDDAADILSETVKQVRP